MLNVHHAHWLGTKPKHYHQSCVGHLRDRETRWAPAGVHPRVSDTVCRAAARHVAGEALLGSQAVLDRYRAMLHEYRLHKASLGSWFASFLSRQRRPPQLLDAEATGDPELVARFQQYLMVRKRLLAEIPLLRDQLQEAVAADGQHHHSSSSSTGGSSSSSASASAQKHHHSHKHGAVNANQVAPISKSQAVGQFFSAVNYRKQHSPRRLGESSSTSSSSSSNSVAPAAAPVAVESPALAVDAAAVDRSLNSQLAISEVLQQQQQQRPAAAAAAESVAAPVTSQGLDALAYSGTGSQVSAAPAAAAAAANMNNSSSSNPKADGAAHLLNAATNQASSSSASSRATAAALAALAYKKQRQQPGNSSSAAESSAPHVRGLAMLQAEAPRLPAGIDAAAAAAGKVVVGVVETAKGDVNAGRRNSRPLDAEVSMEATLQGVPGGLGSAADHMFAAAIAVPTEAGTGSASSSATAGPVAAAAAAPDASAPVAAAAAPGAAPVGEVVTARFDVYAGRKRVLAADAALDEYFAGLAAAASPSPSAADSVAPSSSNSQVTAAAADAASSTPSSKKGDAPGGNKGQQQQQQQAQQMRQAGFGGLLPDIVPLPI